MEVVQFEEETMRITKAYVLVCAVVALLAVLPSQAAEKTPFTATGGSETILFPGIITCPGSPDYPDPFSCPDKMNVPGRIMTRRIDASDPRIDGVVTCDMNFNFDANIEGHYWAKCALVFDLGGVAEGSGTGQIAWTGTPWMSQLFATDQDVNHVTGGPLDGCMLKFEAISDLFTGLINIKGYILDPHEKK